MYYRINKKLGLLLTALCSLTLTSCSTETSVQSSNKPAAGELVPAHYEQSDQNVIFNLTPEVPSGIDVTSIPIIEIEGLQFSDIDTARATFADGKTVINQIIGPANQYHPAEYSYVFDDATQLSSGGSTTTFSTENGRQYGTLLSRLPPDLSKATLSFATPEDLFQAVSTAVNACGYSSDISFDYITLPAEQAQALEYHITPDGQIDQNSYKSSWTEEDNAYIIYGAQQIAGLPVYCEMYLLGQSMAQDIPYNAPIQAVYTTRGLEWLYVMAQYHYHITDETVSLLPFETAAQVVSQKLNNVLAAAPYEVYRAKLFLLVHMDAAQDYSADPVWYFEVATPEDEDALIVLVDAVTGIEIPIG